ncbi:hypothetical protein GLOIN_2v1781498 [Rhizophagus irregularis DAOM 181602=DAOM 197198]|nr:hypothetical protein GLOIN_2v1781498 [Rhizophagus irregularis DAOM 181602=DAOM 197198]
MSDIYEIINSLPEKEETKKLQIHLINHLEKEEMLLLALRSHKNSKDKQSLLKYFLETMSNFSFNQRLVERLDKIKDKLKKGCSMVLSVIDFENMQQLQEHLNLKFKYIEHIKLLLTRMQWLSFNLKGITDIAILTKGYSGCMGQERIRCRSNLVKENLMNLIENYPFVLKKKKINYN